MAESIRILLIAYRFPPQGGGGVQRPAAFVRYWARRGVPVAVLTCTGEAETLHDPTLLDGIPDSVIRVSVPDPGPNVRLRALRERIRNPLGRRLVQGLLFAVFQMSVPDLRAPWRRPAIRAGEELIRTFKPDVIVVTGPPWTPFLVAATLARRHRLPLVLDYRDPWTQSYLEIEQGWIAHLRNAGLERRTVGRADAVIAAHRQILRLLRPWIRPDARRLWVPNGGDAEDVARALARGAERATAEQRFVLGYAGGFFHWRSPRVLIRVLENLQREGRIDAARFRFRMAGSVGPGINELAKDSPVRDLLEIHGYLRHDETIAFLAENTVNLVIEADFGHRNYTTPGKFYELLHIGRPILVLTAPGVTSHLGRHVGGCWTAHPGDEAAIRTALLEILSLWEQGSPLPAPGGTQVEFYERRRQADRLLQFLSSLTNRPLPDATGEPEARSDGSLSLGQRFSAASRR